MKVLKILGLVFGILLLLTGAGLLAGAFAAGKGDDAIAQSMQQNGLVGPVDGVVTAVDAGVLTVDYTDQSGEDQTAEAQAALSRPAQIGDTVSIYYSPDEPSIAVATDLLGGQLSSIASTLRTAGIVCLVLGGLMLIASIVSLVVGRKNAAVTAGAGQPYPVQQPYPPQGQGYPPQPGQGYGPLPGQNYPPQPGQPYAPQPGQPYPPQGQPAQGQPGQGQPPQGQPPQNYSMPPATPYPPAENYDPRPGDAPQGPPSAR